MISAAAIRYGCSSATSGTPARCPGTCRGSPPACRSRAHRLVDRRHRLAQRDALRRLKEMVTAGNWLWWLIDSGATGFVSMSTQRRQRHRLRRCGDWTYSVSSVCRSPACPARLEHQVVGVDLGEILRDLALAERVVQRVVDHLRLDAEARRRSRSMISVSGACRRSAGRWSRRAASAAFCSSVQHLRRPLVELARGRRPAACTGTRSRQRGRRRGCPAPPEERLPPSTLAILRPQAGDDLLRAAPSAHPTA